MSQYGIPYMGSKAKICDKICALFPKAKHFYDLFGGGFSITHCMIERRSKDFQHFHFNEIRPGVSDLIKDAIAGKYNYDVFKPPWISREEFFKQKDHDPYVKIIWSFGNNGKGYLFGKHIEQQKKSFHQAIIFNEFDDYAKKIFGMEKFADGLPIKEKRFFLRTRLRLEQLQQLERLEQLQQLERLEQLERLNFYSTSYENVPIQNDSIIYCDIPYSGTAEYDENSTFNRSQFLNWAAQTQNPVFISEYQINDSRFRCIANIQKRSMLSGTKEKCVNKTEKVFVNNAGFQRLMSKA